jgi:hypothetical protein
MNKKRMISTFLFVLFVAGLALGSALAQDKAAKPVIVESFAAKQVSPYETWKIYVKGSHPEGGMRNIFAVVEQAGAGTYPVSITRLKKENEKDFSGYFYLNSAGASTSALSFVELNLTLWVQDRAGNFSEPATFPLSLNPRFAQAAPPEGKFREENLGPIMIRLRPVSDSARLWPNE